MIPSRKRTRRRQTRAPKTGAPAGGLRGPALDQAVAEVVARAPVLDIHTHLYDPAFRSLLLWGIDELLVYHYLVAEAFRYYDGPAEHFWSWPKLRQADWIWNQLFVQRSPISEACRGVLTTLHRLGLDTRRRDLPALRRWFRDQRREEYVGRVLEVAGVERVCMTNSPFDDEERPVWEAGFTRDPRFLAALRIDPVLVDWPRAAKRLHGWGYRTAGSSGQRAFDGVRRFLAEWSQRLDARYLMVSLPPDFAYPSREDAAQLLEGAVLPFCREQGMPLALMLGVERAINPELRLAGDGVGRSRLEALRQLCAAHPHNRFLVTVLSRENQHELCVLARKFRNLHVFGCWWFTNVPLLVEEITRQRLELVGLSCTLQHSDARVLDQLIYKWEHFRQVLGPVLADKYRGLSDCGWEVSREDVARDVRALLGGEFERFCGVARGGR